MARRGWARSIFLGVLAAAGTATAQIGLGYGLDIIEWASTAADASTAANGAWSASLTWATWVSATSVVVGAVVGHRARGKVDRGRFVSGLWRLVMALAATLGGLIAVPLVAVPASHARIDDNFAPHLLAGIYAAVGVVIGLIVALIATASRAVAANVFVSAGWLWTLAIIARIDGSQSGRDLGYAQLAVWKFTDSGPVWMAYYIPGALVMLGTALLVGGLTAFPAAGRADGRFGIAISGAIGPLLVAAAYLLAAPKTGEVPAEQLSAYYAAPYMVIAGLAGSVLVAAVGGGFSRPPKAVRATSNRGPSGRARTRRPTLPAEETSSITAVASVPAAYRTSPNDHQKAGLYGTPTFSDNQY